MAVAIATAITSEWAPVMPSPLSPLAAYAQTGYPIVVDPYVNDYAELIPPEDAATIRQTLSDLELQHGVEAIVVTIDSIQDFGTGDASIESLILSIFEMQRMRLQNHEFDSGNHYRCNILLQWNCAGDRNMPTVFLPKYVQGYYS